MIVDVCSYEFMSVLAEVDYLEFERLYMTATDEQKQELRGDAPYGKKTEWGQHLRDVENGFHTRMNLTAKQIGECIQGNWESSLLEIVDEIEPWEEEYLWVRLLPAEKDMITYLQEVISE